MTRRERTPDQDREFQAWIERAKRVPIEDVLRRLGATPLADDRGGPCPRPGCCDPRKTLRESDRFSINRRKGLFFCRASGAGGPNFEMVRHVTDQRFMDAVEFVSGEKPPMLSRAESDDERAARERRLELQEQDAQRRRVKEAEIAQRFRDDERRRAFNLWQEGKPIAGTIVEAYLAKRGLVAPPEAHLRFIADAAFWDGPPHQGGKVLFRGPCMAAAAMRFDSSRGMDVFSMLHRTWIDLDERKGKKKIADPKTGELISAKKMRGSKKGASILLARKPLAGSGAIVRWFLSEGIENALAVWRALVDQGSPLVEGAEFRAAGDLGNLAGKAAARVAHPTETMIDTAGRKRRKMAPGPDPIDPDEDPVIAIPPGVADLYLIEDGSSEPFFTQNAILRAGARFKRDYPDLNVLRVPATPGLDHNEMLMAGGAA